MGGAVGALLFTILLARFVFFAAGLVLGGAIGTTLFEVLDQGETSWLLAIVFIPTMAVVGGFLAPHGSGDRSSSGRPRSPARRWWSTASVASTPA